MGYPESKFTSLHQPGGVKKNWTPGRTYYRVLVQSPKKLLYKLCIPPGCTGINLNCGIGQGGNSGACFAARIGEPPTVDPGDGETNGYTLRALKNNCTGRNTGGYLVIAKEQGFFIASVQWLYFVIDVQNTKVIDIVATMTMNPEKYKAWYQSAKWQSNGDPSIGPIVEPVAKFVEVIITSAQYQLIKDGANIIWTVKN